MVDSINSLDDNSSNNVSAIDENDNKCYELDILNANARSLNNKLGSLVDMLNEFEVTFALLTETWFKSGKNLEAELTDLELAEEIGIIARNRSGKRGGGVAISYNKLIANMKEYRFPGNMYEMVCAVGNSIHSNRKITCVAIYIYRQAKNLMKRAG